MTVSVRHAEPLAPWSTLGVGGPARALYTPTTIDALIDLLTQAHRQQERVLVLGGGSNIVFHDDGFDGWVIQPALKTLRFESIDAQHTRVYAGAGVVWDDLVAASTARGLCGIEAMSGIPGHAGAAPIQNIGAYGQELSDTLTVVHAYDRKNETRCTFSNADCAFAYRNSFFKREGGARFVILGIELMLAHRQTPVPLRYKDLQAYFGADHAPDVASVRDAVRVIRARKGMVYDPADIDSHSVGSFFMNPLLTDDACSALRQRAQDLGVEGLPQYRQADGRWKTSAAWLISHAGIERGLRLDGAGVSSRHVLALINPGGATAAAIRTLACHVRDRVAEVWGIRLIPEPRILTPTGLDHRFYS